MGRVAMKLASENRSHRAQLSMWVVAGMVGLGLSGCSLHKPPTHAAIVGQALPQAPVPAAWSAGPEAASVSDDWVKTFNDAGLEVVVREAIANNLDLRQSAARVEEARANIVLVGSKLKPQIGADLSEATTHSNTGETSNQSQSNSEYGRVNWEIDVWGRMRSQRAAAQESYAAVALDYAFARQSLAALTAKSWYLAIETRQLLTLAEQSVAIYTRVLELVKVRRAAGKVADLDVAEASYQLDEAQNQLTIAQGTYSQARRTLEVLVGHYPAAELEVAESFAPVPPPVAPGLPSSLLERRPDVVAAEHGVVAAFRTEEAARLALLPSFSFELEGGRLSDPLLDLVGLNPWLIHSAVGMLVPIYQGGATHAQIRIATAQEEGSIAHFGGVALKAFYEVEVQLTNEGLLGRRLPYMQGAVRDHTEAVRIANLKYKAGSMDLLSVLQLQEGQILSQAELIKLLNAQLANRIDLHLAVGGSFDGSAAASFPAVAGAKAP
jgi:outer membrane protein, multidrug efflux system